MESGTPRFALVTGASGGIGYELAKLLTEDGYDLLIAAEDQEIETARDELAGATRVDAVRVDLSRSEGVERLHEAATKHERPLDALVLNAGIGGGGSFAGGTDLGAEMKLIDLNVKSTVHLCKLEVEPMVKRNRGRILFASTVASARPGADQAIYNASKSFVHSFALSLRDELSGTGVSVTSLICQNEPARDAREGIKEMLE